MATVCLGQTADEVSMEAYAYRQIAIEILRTVTSAAPGTRLLPDDIAERVKRDIRMTTSTGLPYAEEARLVSFAIATVDRFFAEIQPD